MDYDRKLKVEVHLNELFFMYFLFKVFKQYFEMFIDLFSNLLKATDHVSIEVVSSMIV